MADRYREHTVQTHGRRQLIACKREDGKTQIRLFLKGPNKDLATLVLEPAESKNLESALTVINRS